MAYARVIVNPAAGAGKTVRKWPKIMGILKNIGLRFEHDLTEAPGHATELAKSAAQKGYELVVSVGGDGTINEVVNGLHNAGNIGDIKLGIIGTGTGSDFIRTIGIPHHYGEACRRLLNPGTLTVDLGVIEYADDGRIVKRVFVNLAGLGFAAEIARATSKKYKLLNGTASYLLGLLTSLLFYKNKEISITIDGEVEERRVCTVLISNGRYSGGGMLATPDASLTDGFFDVLIIGNLSKPDLLWSLPRVYKGTHLTHPKVTLKRAREVEIRSAEPVLLQADGELLGSGPARFSILPAALNIVA